MAQAMTRGRGVFFILGLLFWVSPSFLSTPVHDWERFVIVRHSRLFVSAVNTPATHSVYRSGDPPYSSGHADELDARTER